MARIAVLTTVHHVHDPRILYKEAASLARSGNEVFLVAFHEQEEHVEGVCIRPVPGARQPHAGAGILRRLSRVRRCYHEARRLEADVYHLHDPELIPAGWLLKRRTGAKVVYDMHEDVASRRGLAGRIALSLENWCFRWTDHVILAEKAYAQRVKGSDVPYSVILNYHLAPRTPATVRPQTPDLRLLYAGTVSAERGLFEMLELAKAIKEERLPWTLTIAGKCHHRDERRRAEEWIEQQGLENIVRVAGWDTFLPFPEMAAFFEHTDIGLALFGDNPNHAQSIATKFYEYAAHGLPVVCSDIPGWKAFVEKHSLGVAVPQGDVEAVLRCILRMTANPDEWEKTQRRVAAAAREFRWEVMEERLLDLYDVLLA